MYAGIDDDHNTVEAFVKMMRGAFPELPLEAYAAGVAPDSPEGWARATEMF